MGCAFGNGGGGGGGGGGAITVVLLFPLSITEFFLQLNSLSNSVSSIVIFLRAFSKSFWQISSFNSKALNSEVVIIGSIINCCC